MVRYIIIVPVANRRFKPERKMCDRPSGRHNPARKGDEKRMMTMQATWTSLRQTVSASGPAVASLILVIYGVALAAVIATGKVIV